MFVVCCVCVGKLVLHTGPVHKVLFKFRRLEIPPNYDVDHLGKSYRLLAMKFIQKYSFFISYGS